MKPRRYFSARTGAAGVTYDLAGLRRLFLASYRDFLAREYFQRMLGKDCVDGDGTPSGIVGPDVEAYVLLRLRKEGLWPIAERISAYTEADIFDMIEFLFDHVAKGVDGYMHSYAGCGMHYQTFEEASAREEWRASVNLYLPDYGEGFLLSESGEVLRAGEPAFQALMGAAIPGASPKGVQDRVEAAIAKFRSRTASWDERREAVRTLADVLEFLRPDAKEVLSTKDEADLFNIANNFAIRHHNQKQRTDYDPAIWLNWMFYFYLATIHAAQRLINRRDRAKTGS